ncbi:MAG: trypsin-like peptidase domain-containing protein [Planctomycetes bacterium]|nr:trypsin-like peptidase domain-containing protein [Planctomycetota bacterium]
MNNPPEPVLAGLFHAGNTCPFCQESITAGQLVVTCKDCGSIHHETCWLHKQGCASYHCDKSVSMDNPARAADIVLSLEDVAKAPPPPPPRKPRSAQEVAAAYMQPEPTRTSRLAIAGTAMVGLSLMGVYGAATGLIPVMAAGLVLAFMGMVTGIVSLLRISNRENRISGFALAISSTLVPVVLIVVYFAILGSQLSSGAHQHQVNLQIHENLPSEEQLDRMPPAVGRAMRANVVVRSQSGLEQSLGSGIIMNKQGSQAYILTNKHVIGSQKENIEIVFYTGEESRAKVEWEAPEGVDLALLSCQAIALANYKPIAVETRQVDTGESVFAVGNPMGLTWTYTEGIVSGQRKISGGPNGVELYQTQTPINSGNSGGGLYTRDGRLAGINTLTEDKQVAEGLSFAISSTTLFSLLNDAEKKKWFGVEGREP